MKLLFILSLVVSLNACGVKPDSLKAPDGYDGRTFPSTYPDR